MSKAVDLKNTSELVKNVLKHDLKARNSDSFLYLRLLEIMAVDTGVDIRKIPVTDFLMNMQEMGFPPFESVRRARQKAQEKFPELMACKAVEAARTENEKEYKAFALS